MNREKLSGLKIVGKIDLENLGKSKSSFEKDIEGVVEKSEKPKELDVENKAKEGDIIRSHASVRPAKILGKIDLDEVNKYDRKVEEEKRNERKDYVRSYREILRHIESAMDHNISLVQERMSSFEGAPDNLVNQDGSINVDSFEEIYDESEISFDKHIAQEKKKYHYRTFDPAIQKKYRTDDQLELIKRIERNKKEKMRDGNVSEDLLFLMMNKVAGDRYITLKASEYDDFENGVDMVLVDTETDAVICTFDATVSGINSRISHKMERAEYRVDRGRGLFMKYGVSFDEDQKMKLGSIQNIPPLFLDLEKTDLKKLLRIMDFHIDSELSDAEIHAVSDLLVKLDDQIEDLDKRAAKNISYDSSREFVAHVRNTLAELQKPE